MIDWLETHMATCLFVKYFHFECPGCGTQRALIALLKGNLTQSIQFFPALIPYICTLLMLGIQLAFPFKKGGYAVMFGFMASVAIMLGNYLFKLVA